jgi:hypothetical protein
VAGGGIEAVIADGEIATGIDIALSARSIIVMAGVMFATFAYVCTDPWPQVSFGLEPPTQRLILLAGRNKSFMYGYIQQQCGFRCYKQDAQEE